MKTKMAESWERENRVYKEAVIFLVAVALQDGKGITQVLDEEQAVSIYSPYRNENETWSIGEVLAFSGASRENFRIDCMTCYMIELEMQMESTEYQLKKLKELAREKGMDI
ncbi:hypothetical protein D1872_81770 [compost metagenome]